MDLTPRITARAARALCISLFAVAAATLVGCGGGDKSSSGPGQTNSIGAQAMTADGTTGAAPMTLTFVAANSRGEIASYEWNMRDNSAVKMGATVQHTFMEPGSYNVTLTVRDAAGNYNTSGLMVNVQGAGALCASAPTEFTTKVWPAMSGNCTLCHTGSGVASGSALVFTAGTPLQNYNILRSYALKSEAALLAKVIGQQGHTGGAAFGSATDPRYLDLAALVPVMKQTCVTDPIGSPVAGQFWAGVKFASDQKVLAKAAVLFGGRSPTAAEEAAVTSGGAPVLRQTIRSYMQGPAFNAFLDELGETWFLTRGSTVFGNNMGYNATDWPSAVNMINNTNLQANERNRFTRATQVEPIELLKYVANNDKPYTDIVNGRYTLVNAIVAQYMQATVTGTFADPANDTVFLPATLPSQRLGGVREHAGVLSTQEWQSRFPTTPTNRNRHRVYIFSKQFLGTDVAALAVRPIDDGGNFKIPTVENPGCSVCHDVIDPMAAGFQNWQENNRYLPFRTASGVNHALPGSYRSGNYPKDANNMAYYKDGDNWFRDEKAPGYLNTPMPGGVTGNPTALQWLGDQIAADQRFAIGAVKFFMKGVIGRDQLKAPLDASTPENAFMLSAYNAQNEEYQQIADRFRMNRGNGAYNVKDLLVDLVMSQWARAESVTGLTAGRAIELKDVGGMNLLSPTALNRKATALLGQAFNDFNNPLAGFGLNYGNFNGIDRNDRPTEYTSMQDIAMHRQVATRSCAITQNDFGKMAATRLLFPNVALTDTPATAAGQAAIQDNIRYLTKHLWKEDVPVTDAEVQRTYQLFNAVWADRANAPARATTCAFNNTNDPNYTGRAWAIVIAYMSGDKRFLFE
jgi:hypothetical protein